MSDNPERAAKTARQSAGVFGQFGTVESGKPEPAEQEPAIEEAHEEEIIEEEEFDDSEADVVDDVDDEVEEPETDDRYVVRVDGEEVEVTLDELLSGYSRQSDYTRKTQALADERRQFQQERENTTQLASVLEQRLSEVENLLSGQDEAPNWVELAKKLDPREYAARKAQWDAQQEQLSIARQQREELKRLQAEEQRRQFEEARRQGEQMLPKVIPEWQDADKARNEAQSIVRWATEQGFSQEALDNLVDPLAVKVLRDAWLYNQSQQQKPKIVKKKAPKTAKAGTGVKSKRKSVLEKQINTPGKPREKIDFFKSITPLK